MMICVCLLAAAPLASTTGPGPAGQDSLSGTRNGPRKRDTERLMAAVLTGEECIHETDTATDTDAFDQAPPLRRLLLLPASYPYLPLPLQPLCRYLCLCLQWLRQVWRKTWKLDYLRCGPC